MFYYFFNNLCVISFNDTFTALDKANNLTITMWDYSILTLTRR